MANFTKENLSIESEYIIYRNGTESKFVARLKYGQKTSRGPFVTFLTKNFTVEEYFSRMENGESPLGIMQSKGFILSHIKKWLREGGYPVTQEGYKQYLDNESARFRAMDATR